MRYHLMLFICVSLCDGFFCISYVQENEISSSCEKIPCENGGSCIVKNEGEKEFFCICKARYSGKRCELDKCSLLQCKENEVCVEENGDVQCIIIRDPCTSNPCKNGGSCISDLEEEFTCICAARYIGKICETDQCSCQENEVCVEENGDFVCEKRDPCTLNPCKNEGTCIAKSDFEEGFVCNCAVEYSGKTCEIDQCDLRQCHENEECVVENGDVECKIKGDMTKDLATTTPTKATSSITTHTEKYNKTTTSGNIVETTTVKETSNTNQLLSSSSIVTRSTTAFIKITTKISKTTKNKFATTTKVSFSDQSSRSVDMTSETNADEHHKYFTKSSSSPPVGKTTAFDNNTVKTSHSLTDGLTTVEYTTNTTNLFKSSTPSSPKLISQSSTSMSTSDDNSGYTSERPQSTLSTSTSSKEKTMTIDFKSTGTYASTIETLNDTSANSHDPGNDINRTNESSQTITIYASLGAVCFAVLIAFAVGGWYIRRRCRRRKRQCYTECDTSSQISRYSDSSYSSP